MIQTSTEWIPKERMTLIKLREVYWSTFLLSEIHVIKTSVWWKKYFSYYIETGNKTCSSIKTDCDMIETVGERESRN